MSDWQADLKGIVEAKDRADVNAAERHGSASAAIEGWMNSVVSPALEAFGSEMRALGREVAVNNGNPWSMGVVVRKGEMQECHIAIENTLKGTTVGVECIRYTCNDNGQYRLPRSLPKRYSELDTAQVIAFLVSEYKAALWEKSR